MFGKRLKKLREEKELTQNQLGKLVNLSQQTIGHYEVGRAKPDLETLKMFSEIFNVTIDYLLCRTNNRSEPSGIVTGTGDGSFTFDKDIPENVRKQIIDYAEYLIRKHKEGN